MTDLIKKEVQTNINELTQDPIIRAMAIETIKGEAQGIRIDFNGVHFLTAAHSQYLNRGGTIEPIVVGVIAEAIKKVRNELSEITANQLRGEQNATT